MERYELNNGEWVLGVEVHRSWNAPWRGPLQGSAGPTMSLAKAFTFTVCNMIPKDVIHVGVRTLGID